MSISSALSTRVKHLCARQSIDLKVDTLHPHLYLLTPSQPNQKLFSYLPQVFADQSQEVSYAVFIDQDNHVVACDIVGIGDLRKTVVDLGSVIQRLALHRTRRVLLAHNHPGHTPIHSNADRQLTTNMTNLAGLLNIEFLGHYVVTPTGCFTAGHAQTPVKKPVYLIDHDTTFNSQVVQVTTPVEQTANPTLWETGIDLSHSFATAAFGQALLPNINRKWNVTTAVFLNSNFDAMAYLPFDKPVTPRRLVKAAIMTNTTLINLFVPTGQNGLTPNAFQGLHEQLQHYQLQLLDQITYTSSYNDELAYDSLLEDWHEEN